MAGIPAGGVPPVARWHSYRPNHDGGQNSLRLRPGPDLDPVEPLPPVFRSSVATLPNATVVSLSDLVVASSEPLVPSSELPVPASLRWTLPSSVLVDVTSPAIC